MVSSTIDILSRIKAGREALIVDGMLSGTGVRLKQEGGFVDLERLAIAHDLRDRITAWVKEYEDQQYQNFCDREECERLDRVGLEIANLLEKTLSSNSVAYFSSSKSSYI